MPEPVQLGWHKARQAVAPQASCEDRSAADALDRLRAEDIPADKRLDGLPKNVVAVLGEVRGRHAGEVRGLAASRDGKLLATVADQDMKVRLWDAQTLQPLGALAGHRAFVNCVAPLCRRSLAGLRRRVWGLLSLGHESHAPERADLSADAWTINKFNNSIHATAFSPDGKTLAVAGDAGSVDLFDMSGAQPVDRGVLAGITQQVHSLTFSPDGTILALAGLEDGSARLWDLTAAAPREKAVLKRPGRRCAPMPPVRPGDVPVSRRSNRGGSPSEPASFLSLSPRTARPWRPSRMTAAFAYGTYPGPSQWTVVRLKVRPGQRDPAQEAARRHDLWPRGPTSMTFSPDGTTLAAAQPSGWIRLWDLKDGEPTERADFPRMRGRSPAC